MTTRSRQVLRNRPETTLMSPTSGLGPLEPFIPARSAYLAYGSSRGRRHRGNVDDGHCGVRRDNRALLRESGARSDIPPSPSHAVARSTSRGKKNAPPRIAGSRLHCYVVRDVEESRTLIIIVSAPDETPKSVKDFYPIPQAPLALYLVFPVYIRDNLFA